MSSWTTDWGVSLLSQLNFKMQSVRHFPVLLACTDSCHVPITAQTRTSQACWLTYSCDQLLGLRHTDQISNTRQDILNEITRHGLLCYWGSRGGRNQHRYHQLRLTTNSVCGRIDQASVGIVITDIHTHVHGRSRSLVGLSHVTVHL